MRQLTFTPGHDGMGKRNVEYMKLQAIAALDALVPLVTHDEGQKSRYSRMYGVAYRLHNEVWGRESSGG